MVFANVWAQEVDVRSWLVVVREVAPGSVTDAGANRIRGYRGGEWFFTAPAKRAEKKGKTL